MSAPILAAQPVRCPGMSVVAPEPLSSNAFRRILSDLYAERVAPVPFPPGPNDFNVERTFRFVRDPLPILLPLYREHGPIFSMRVFHGRVVFMLGPAANHFVTVSNADKFHWRTGSMGDLIPLLGDGLLTIDGDYHRRARRIMLPAFHRERIAASHDTMVEETRAGARRLARGRDARRLPLGAPAHAARRDARAVRARPRRAGQGRAGGDRVRACAELLRHRLRRAHHARPAHAVEPHAGRAQGARPHRLRRDRAPPPAAGPRAHRRAVDAAGGDRRRGRLAPERPRGARPGDDAAVRRARHLDLDDLLHALRARAPPGGAREAARRAGPRARRPRCRPPPS